MLYLLFIQVCDSYEQIASMSKLKRLDYKFNGPHKKGNSFNINFTSHSVNVKRAPISNMDDIKDTFHLHYTLPP